MGLNQYFAIETGKSLTKANMKHLYDRFFGPKNHNTKQLVRWSMFAVDRVVGQNFTFWEWFNGIVKLTKHFLKPLWVSDRIMGFITKTGTSEMLSECEVGTFILRFSESVLGGVSVAWVDNDSTGYGKVVNMTVPFTANELHCKGIMEYLHEMPCCKYIYPDTPKIVGLSSKEYPAFSFDGGCEEEGDVLKI